MHIHKFSERVWDNIRFENLSLPGVDQCSLSIRFCIRCGQWDSQITSFRGDVLERLKMLREYKEMIISSGSIARQEKMLQRLQ